MLRAEDMHPTQTDRLANLCTPLPPRANLTPRAKDVLEAVVRLSHHGISPSFDELRAELGMRSRATVHWWLQRLAAGGYIHKMRHRARGLIVTDRGHQALGHDPPRHSCPNCGYEFR